MTQLLGPVVCSTMGAAGSRPYTGAAGMSRTGPELPLAVAAGEAVDLNKDLSPEARPPTTQWLGLQLIRNLLQRRHPCHLQI